MSSLLCARFTHYLRIDSVVFKNTYASRLSHRYKAPWDVLETLVVFRTHRNYSITIDSTPAVSHSLHHLGELKMLQAVKGHAARARQHPKTLMTTKSTPISSIERGEAEVAQYNTPPALRCFECSIVPFVLANLAHCTRPDHVFPAQVHCFEVMLRRTRFLYCILEPMLPIVALAFAVASFRPSVEEPEAKKRANTG